MSDEKDGKNEKDDLLEVVRAIEELREKHGTTNKQIFKFVRKRLRNPKEPIKVYQRDFIYITEIPISL